MSVVPRAVYAAPGLCHSLASRGMPLPRDTEVAARKVQRRIDEYDAALLSWSLGTGRLPSLRAVMADVRPLLIFAVSAALSDAGEPPTRSQVLAAVQTQQTAIERALRSSEGQARAAKRKLPRTLPTEDDDEPAAVLVRRVGAVTAAAVLVAALKRDLSVRVRQIETRKIAGKVGARVPRRVSPYARMVVRTESAIARNGAAADIAERDDKVLLIRDAMKGPTDRECEVVDGKYATAKWLRKHPVEHPNCTRRGRPAKLPKGRHVTLLD